jgi:long-subunit fatty acid transport protein
VRQFAALLIVASASASEPELFGVGARSAAMAGTGTADAEGWEASYANPAGVVGLDRRRISVGYVGARYHLRLDGQQRGEKDTDGVYIGANLPLPFGGILKDRLAIGLAFYYPVGIITTASAPYPDQPRLALLDTRTKTVSVLVAAGARVHRRVRLGIGVLALAALIGNIAITPDAGGRITTLAEEQLITDFAPVAGIRVEATRFLQLGLVLRGESKSQYDLRVTNSLGPRLPVQLPTLHIAGTAQFDPLQLQLEAGFRHKWLAVDVGIAWKHWSDFPVPVENATPGAPPQPPTRYHDTAVPRLGLEANGAWGKWRLAGRLGYFFEQSPAPPDQTILVDANRHAITAGLGWGWGRAWSFSLDVFGQLHVLADSPHAGGVLGVFGATLGLDL